MEMQTVLRTVLFLSNDKSIFPNHSSEFPQAQQIKRVL